MRTWSRWRSRLSGRMAGGVAVAIVATGLTAAAPAPASTAPIRAVGGVEGVEGVVAALLDTTGVRALWTPERMAAAVPLDLAPDGTTTAPAAAGSGAGQVRARAGLVAPRSVGKLFFTTPGGPAVCSASALNTASRDSIITAAHCVHSGAPTACGSILFPRTCPGAYYGDFLFVPRYTDGAGPDGAWVGTRVLTTPQWIASEDLAFDQAVVQVAPLQGRRLVDVVGGNGLGIGYSPRQDGVEVWGWPAQAPFDGETVEVCTGSTDVFPGTTDAALSCPLTGGASGGPWFSTKVDGDVGYIWAVTSRRTTSGPPVLIAQPFTSAILDLVNAVGGGVGPRTVAGEAVLGGAAPTSGRIRKVRTTTRGIRLAATPAVARTDLFGLRVRAGAGRRVVIERREAGSRTWRRVLVTRTDRSGLAQITLRALDPGVRVYRARSTGRRLSKAVAVRISACPVPRDRTPGVAGTTGCTDPSR